MLIKAATHLDGFHKSFFLHSAVTKIFWQTLYNPEEKVWFARIDSFGSLNI